MSKLTDPLPAEICNAALKVCKHLQQLDEAEGLLRDIIAAKETAGQPYQEEMAEAEILCQRIEQIQNLLTYKAKV